MADRPILFSAPMIQALLAGRKAQTRRVLPVQPPAWATFCHQPDMLNVLHQWVPSGLWSWADTDTPRPPQKIRFWPVDKDGQHVWLRPPFAKRDRLWVRETWSHTADGVFEIAQARLVGRGGVIYAADKNPHAPHAKFWPSIHMPREFSRLTLIVTDVRVERLQDISWADARAEGVEMESADPPFYYVPGIHPHSLTAVGVEETGGRHAERSFEKLWDLINAKRGFGWAANPWVCALTFTVHRCNIDSMEAAGA